jgi:hypothetical protein
MNLLQKDIPILAKIYEAKCLYDSRNNRITLYYKNRVTAQTLVDSYNLSATPPPNSSLYVIYDLQTGKFNVSTDPPTYKVSNSKVYVTSPINAEYDIDKVIIYRISSYEMDTAIDLNYILTQLTQLNANKADVTQLDAFVHKQQADTITAIHTFNPTQPGPAFQLGSNAQNQLIQYLNADEVDGFHASLTPAPNTIVPLNPQGILDLSSTYIRSNVYTFRRVDLSNATSDYMLQVGEEAYISFSNTTSVPLRIATQSGTYYEMDLISFVQLKSGTNNPVFLNPNNTTYSNAFTFMNVYINDSINNPSSSKVTYNAFRISWGVTHARVYIHNITTAKSVKSLAHVWDSTSNGCALTMELTYWNDTSTAWTSLGTITFPQSTSGYILVRRLA